MVIRVLVLLSMLMVVVAMPVLSGEMGVIKVSLGGEVLSWSGWWPPEWGYIFMILMRGQEDPHPIVSPADGRVRRMGTPDLPNELVVYVVGPAGRVEVARLLTGGGECDALVEFFRPGARATARLCCQNQGEVRCSADAALPLVGRCCSVTQRVPGLISRR